MAGDPFGRPSMEDLREVLESIGKSEVDHGRGSDRLELSVPAEVMTIRGNSIPAMTREISRTGIGLLHKGAIRLGEARVKMASETRQFEYRILLEWCRPCENGMFISGGRFLSREQ